MQSFIIEKIIKFEKVRENLYKFKFRVKHFDSIVKKYFRKRIEMEKCSTE